MQDQWLFVGLDSVPCGLAAVVLNIWHPGYCFPEEKQKAAEAEKTLGGNSSGEEEAV
jgi:hypothetical protein